MPLLLFHDPLPQPNSANTYGPLTATDAKQSIIVNLSGKLTFRKFQLRASIPFGRMYKPMGLSGEPVRESLPEDSRCNPQATGFDPTCLDSQLATRGSRFDSFDRYVVGEYRDRFANDKAGITLRGYAQEFVRTFAPLQVLAPSSLIQGGLAFETNPTSYRAGAQLDGDVEAADKLRIVYGAEAFHEWKPIDTDRSRQGAGTQTTFLSPYDLSRLPILCPRSYDAATGMLTPVPGCPTTFTFDANRTVLGAYAAPQFRPNKKLILDAGARLQVAPPGALGSVSYPVTLTAAGTIVYNFIPNWHLKLNYAQGFRPPVFNNTSSNGESVQIAGRPDLSVEQSDAAQVEINARIFKGERRIRELTFRVDGSYTRLSNLIQVSTGAYSNSGDRAISSAEFLGKLYIQGGHRIELGYTYMRAATADRGLLRSLPEHWFNLATVFTLAENLSGTTNLEVVGAAEDPNRLVDYRDSTYDSAGNPMNPITVNPTDLVLDRIPPIAELSLGVTWTPRKKLAVRATVYNALFAHSYQPDVFFDYEPHLEYLPNPYEGTRAYVSALYQY
jgi:outer membrane receptor protein involved in Fe transport